MGFHDVQFPIDIPYGLRGGAGFNTALISPDSGQMTAVARWGTARGMYNVAYTIRSLDQLYTMRAFHLARGGSQNTFRFRDFFDYTTAANGRDAHTNADVQVGVGTGSSAQYQIIKKYTSGPTVHTRNLTKIVSGTGLVAFNGVNQPSGWSINDITGTLTANAPLGQLITMGCQFDVHARFGEGADRLLSATYEDFSTGAVSDIPIYEELDGSAVNEDFFFGGGVSKSFSASMTLSPGDAHLQVLNATVGSLTVTLHDFATITSPLGHYFTVHNAGANSFIIRDYGGSTLVTLAAGKTVRIFLAAHPTLTRFWLVTS